MILAFCLERSFGQVATSFNSKDIIEKRWKKKKSSIQYDAFIIIVAFCSVITNKFLKALLIVKIST